MKRQERRRRERERVNEQLEFDVEIPEDALCVLVITPEDFTVTLPESISETEILVAAKEFGRLVHSVALRDADQMFDM